MRTHPTGHAEQGGAMMAMIILLAVIGVGIGIAANRSSQFVREAKIIEKSGQREELRRLIRVRTSCSQIKNSGVARGQVSLLDLNGNRIDGRRQGPLVIGDWTVSVANWNRTTGVMTISASTRWVSYNSLFDATAPYTCI